MVAFNCNQYYYYHVILCGNFHGTILCGMYDDLCYWDLLYLAFLKYVYPDENNIWGLTFHRKQNLHENCEIIPKVNYCYIITLLDQLSVLCTLRHVTALLKYFTYLLYPSVFAYHHGTQWSYQWPSLADPDRSEGQIAALHRTIDNTGSLQYCHPLQRTSHINHIKF